MYHAAPLTSFWFSRGQTAPAEFCRSDLGGRKGDLRLRFFGLHRGRVQHFGCLTINCDDIIEFRISSP
jgi:hypothetical protein